MIQHSKLNTISYHIDNGAFNSNGFTGELIIPGSVTTVSGEAFNDTDFSRIINKSSAEILLPRGECWYSPDTFTPVFNIISANSTVDRAIIQIAPSSDELYFNSTNNKIQLKVSITDSNGRNIADKVNPENKKFTWKVTTSDGYETKDASIDQNGLLTINKEGFILVSATVLDSWTGLMEFRTIYSSIIPTTTPAVTPSTSPAATPSVTPSVRPSTTPALSPTVTPTASPTVTPTAAPTGTPEATTTPTPSAAPEPTGEPEPTLTPEPTQAPAITPGPVSTPEGITVEPTLGSKKVDLSWNPIPDADGYIILVKDAKTGEFKRIKTINDPNVTSFSKTMGELGGLYTFKIQSFKKTENGPSVYKDLGGEIPVQLYAYNKAEKPEVKGTTKTGSKKVHFQWEKIDGADGYLIYKLNPSTKQYELLEKIEGEDTLSYDLSEGLGNGETYSFRVRSYAVSHNGEQVDGKISATIKVTTPPVKAKKPAAVSKVKNEAQISWPAVNNAKGYRVYRSTSKNGKYSSVKTVKGGSSLSFTDKNLKSGKVYFYKIRAYSENPDGSKSFGAMSAARKIKVK